MKNRIALYLMIFMLSVSCSVLEDRRECPCYLSFAHDGFMTGGYDGMLDVVVFEDTKVSDGSYQVSVLQDGIREIPVPKGKARIGCVGGLSSCHLEDSLLIIPTGSDCDPVYGSGASADAFGEVAYVDATLRKQHARLTIGMRKRPSETFPFAIKAVSNVSGFNVLTGKPIVGDFEFFSRTVGEGLFAMILPRQVDNSLVLEIWRTSGGKADEIPLGQYLSDSLGYDWMADDLADIVVFIDYSLSVLSISVGDWELGGSFEFEI